MWATHATAIGKIGEAQAFGHSMGNTPLCVACLDWVRTQYNDPTTTITEEDIMAQGVRITALL